MTPGPSLVELVSQRILSGEARLPVFHAVAARIQQEISREEPDPRRIEQLVGSDQALTAEVLRFSNSAFYKGLNQVTTVRNAIVRLGVNEVANIVMTVTHESQFRSRDPVLHAVLRKLWRHALATAVAAHWLARTCGTHALVHEAFFAGLLHDVGKLFVVTVIEDLPRLAPQAAGVSPAILQEAMDRLHAAEGYRLMKHWELPETYAEVVRDHHRPAGEGDPALLNLVRLADRVCNKAGFGLAAPPPQSPAASPEARALRVAELDLARLEIELEDSPLLGSGSKP